MAIKPTPDQVTAAVDLIRALSPTTNYRADASQFIDSLAAALCMERDEIVLRLANYHERHIDEVTEYVFDKQNGRIPACY